MSGYPGEVSRHDPDLPAGMHFLQKPFSPTTLAQAIRACLDEKNGNTTLAA
jgi:hypothetical protein